MQVLIWLLVMSLATARLSQMVTLETGPFEVFSSIRMRLFKSYGEDHWMTEGIYCPHCVSFWLAFVVSIPILWMVSPVLYVVFALGVAGLASLIFDVTGFDR